MTNQSNEFFQNLREQAIKFGSVERDPRAVKSDLELIKKIALKNAHEGCVIIKTDKLYSYISHRCPERSKMLIEQLRAEGFTVKTSNELTSNFSGYTIPKTIKISWI